MNPTIIKFVLVLIIISYNLSFAQWSNDPTINTPICTIDSNQESPQIISDGKGGAIICWFEYREGYGFDIYAQRVDSSGYIKWNPDGLRVSPISDFQFSPQIVSDQEGGAIITWQAYHYYGDDEDIYAQRIDSFGNILWDTLGVEICVNPNPQINPIIVSDGVGGAIILWEDRESGAGLIGLYSQRVNSSGQVLWATNGIPIATSSFSDPIQFHPQMVSDTNEGAIIAWDDTRGFDDHIYAQRVNDGGTILWPTDGLKISQHFSGENRLQDILSSDNGEYFVAWTNEISTFFETDIYAQKIDTSGVMKWDFFGVPICTETNNQSYCSIASDGYSGAIFTWQDRRGTGVDLNIFAQRIDSAGVIQWQMNGIPVDVDTNFQVFPQIISDGDGGAIICWDHSDGSFADIDIYAQRIDETGTLNWQITGVPISIVLERQRRVKSISDDKGGAIMIWEDYRNGENNKDIFAQRINHSGILGNPTDIDDEQLSNQLNKYVLSQNYPNPFNPSTIISWQSPVGSWQTLKIYDLLGNEITTLADEFKPAGTYEVEWNANSLPAVRQGLPSGVYFYQLKIYPANGGAEGFVETKKMILMK